MEDLAIIGSAAASVAEELLVDRQPNYGEVCVEDRGESGEDGRKMDSNCY